MSLKGVGALALLALGFLTALYARGEVWKRRAAANGLRADSIEAVLDTSRSYLVGELIVSERRVLQLRTVNDSLAQANRRLAATRGVIRIAPRAVDTVLIGEVTQDSVIRRAAFSAYSEPYQVNLAVELPPPPLPGRAHVAIRSDTARLVLATHCGQPVNGVRPATIAVTAPWWLPARVDSAQATQVVCNDRIVERLRHGPSYYAVRGGVAALLILGGIALVLR